MEQRYDVVLLQTDGVGAVDPATIRKMTKFFDHDQGLNFVEIEDENNGQCCAVGFIRAETYEALDYDMRSLGDYIREIMEDINKETSDGVYETALKPIYASKSAKPYPMTILMRYGF